MGDWEILITRNFIVQQYSCTEPSDSKRFRLFEIPFEQRMGLRLIAIAIFICCVYWLLCSRAFAANIEQLFRGFDDDWFNLPRIFRTFFFVYLSCVCASVWLLKLIERQTDGYRNSYRSFNKIHWIRLCRCPK